jgi:hypothetical protein
MIENCLINFIKGKGINGEGIGACYHHLGKFHYKISEGLDLSRDSETKHLLISQNYFKDALRRQAEDLGPIHPMCFQIKEYLSILSTHMYAVFNAQGH